MTLVAMSQLRRLKLDNVLTCSLIEMYRTIGQQLSYGIQPWHDGRLIHGVCIYSTLMLISMALVHGHNGFAEENIFSLVTVTVRG